MKASDLKQLAQEHLYDAIALRGAGRFAGAIYLAGYAVECALKFRICETLEWDEFPPNSDHRALKSHDLNFLLNYTGMNLLIKKGFLVQWSKVEAWNPEMRYETSLNPTAEECETYITNVARLATALIPFFHQNDVT